MKYNLILPFLIREAGLIFNDIPKFQAIQPTINYHSIFSPKENIRISLLLYGIFSYFLLKCPSNEILNDKDCLPTATLSTPVFAFAAPLLFPRA